MTFRQNRLVEQIVFDVRFLQSHPLTGTIRRDLLEINQNRPSDPGLRDLRMSCRFRTYRNDRECSVIHEEKNYVLTESQSKNRSLR